MTCIHQPPEPLQRVGPADFYLLDGPVTLLGPASYGECCEFLRGQHPRNVVIATKQGRDLIIANDNLRHASAISTPLTELVKAWLLALEAK